MTSFSYHLDLSESEAIALRAALLQYLSNCESKINLGDTVPFTSHLQSTTEMLKRLEESATLTSWNNFSELYSTPKR